MYKKISNTVLFIILGIALVLAILKAEAAEEVGVRSDTVRAKAGSSQSVPAGSAAAVSSETTVSSSESSQEFSPAAKAENVTTPAGTTRPAKPASDIKSKTLLEIFREKGINPSEAVISIIVDKSDRSLSLLADGRLMKSYPVELGGGGPGDKEISGDRKTPEGTFYVTEKSILSPADYYLGSRWMELSYPNIEDAERGLKAGLISKEAYDDIVSAIKRGAMPSQNTALGGGIGIHGGSRDSLGNNWTWGCVGLTNKDVEELYGYVRIGTEVVINK